MSNNIFSELLKNVPEKVKKLVQKQNDIAEQIVQIIDNTDGLTQRILAERMGKTESYISRVLSGNVNLTLKTIVAFEKVLDEKILIVPTLISNDMEIGDAESIKSLSIDSKFTQYYKDDFHEVIISTFQPLSTSSTTNETSDELVESSESPATNIGERSTLHEYGNVAYA